MATQLFSTLVIIFRIFYEFPAVCVRKALLKQVNFCLDLALVVRMPFCIFENVPKISKEQ